MLYVSMCLCTIVNMLYCYFFAKTYQLCGYNIHAFFEQVFSFSLSIGSKNKLVLTKRMSRFLFLLVLISLAIFYLINRLVSNRWILLLDYIVVLLLCPIIMAVAHFIILPLEILIKKYYIAKAKRTLTKKNIVKIAITGSYGKTSTKNILCAILEKEYKVCVSPGNYNTEMGLTKTILENLDDHDVLIAEMGARHKGDIKTLTQIVNPDYAIITTIGKQHIESFKSLENIEDTKFELAQNMTKEGNIVFNGDSPSSLRLYHRYQGRKYLTCAEHGFSYPTNIKVSKSGCEFDMIIDGKVVPLKTQLLGMCNIDNIVTASTMAYILGISIEDITSAVKNLEPTSHRLELLTNDYCTILDDSYNSNLIGAKQALEVLSKFEGNKIIVTPGIVEMGKEASMANFKLGTLIADCADYIIIMNDVNKNFLFSGAISHNFDKEKIFFCSSRKKQKEILSLISTKGSVILFENDLPDNFK